MTKQSKKITVSKNEALSSTQEAILKAQAILKYSGKGIGVRKGKQRRILSLYKISGNEKMTVSQVRTLLNKGLEPTDAEFVTTHDVYWFRASMRKAFNMPQHDTSVNLTSKGVRHALQYGVETSVTFIQA
jgi:hypothetical protein